MLGGYPTAASTCANHISGSAGQKVRLTAEMSPEVGGGTTQAEMTGAAESVDSPPSDIAL